MEPDLDAAEALFAKGNLCLKAKDFPGAAAHFRKALELAPDLAEAYINLGLALENTGALEAAESAYFHALAIDPEFAELHVNLGALLVRQKRFQEAEDIYAVALQAFPDSAALWTGLGTLRACMQHDGEAEQCFRKALNLDGNHHHARFNLSYILLRHGHFEEGWQALESRARNVELTASIPASRWHGQSLVGKSLIIAIEGGCGDLIQHARFVPLLKNLGATRIGFVCHPPLKRLFATLTGIDKVLVLDEPVSESDWDYWTLPLSLPLYCRTRLDSIPAPIPYLKPSPEQIGEWRSRIPRDGLRVGLAWKGNPRHENDADRSLPQLGALAPLAAIEGVHFVSLQKGPGEDEAKHPPAGMELLDASPWLEDFADTAALVANLDLVISVDTAVAHLAGALGKPCWILLPYYKTDARWLSDREDSPWYPGTMRLFRQSSLSTWPPVIEEVAHALRDLTNNRDPDRARS